MKITGNFTVTQVYVSDKSGATYVTLSDLDNGGTVKVVADGTIALKPGEKVSADIDVLGRPGKDNTLSLHINGGGFRPIKVSYQPAAA